MNKRRAKAQANRLQLFAHLPYDAAQLLWHTVANPLASSDMLLIVADAIRAANHPTAIPLADAIAALAPSRANRARKEPQ